MTDKLKLMLVDAVASILLYFGAKYLDPSISEDIKFMVTLLQPLVILWLVGEYAKEFFVIKLMNKFNPEQFAILFKEVMGK